jgi:hypothetical protein
MTAPTRRSGPGERVRVLRGDLLTARDLAADREGESRLRALHVRAVHDSWGIALGFYPVTSDAGDAILVGPGLAYDACGREIVLEHPTVLDRPTTAPVVPAGRVSWFDLVIREREARPVWRWAYAGTTASRSAAEPPLADDVGRGRELAVARVSLDDQRVMGRALLTTRRGARGPDPRVVTRRIEGDALGSSYYPEHWRYTIDLSDAGFTRPPMLFVSLERHPLLSVPAYQNAMGAILGPFIELSTVTATAAVVDVRFARTAGSSFQWPPAPFMTLPVPLQWVAVEPPDRAEPRIVTSDARTVDGRRVPNLDARFRRLRAYPPPGGVTE